MGDQTSGTAYWMSLKTDGKHLDEVKEMLLRQARLRGKLLEGPKVDVEKDQFIVSVRVLSERGII